MATHLRDITQKAHPPTPTLLASAGPAAGAGPLAPAPANGSLPESLCPQCEYTEFGWMKGADPADEASWKSPYRLAREASDEPRAYPYRCRSCGEVKQEPPADPTMTAIR